MMKTENRPITLGEHPDFKLIPEEVGVEDTLIIHLTGMIDTYNADFFRIQISKVIDEGYVNIIIDATAATYMTSAGIGAFAALMRAVRRKGGSLIIFGIPKKIFEVFKLLGFASFFHFCNTREEALRSVNIESPPADVFPVTLTCPVCFRRLEATKPGRFGCPSCKTPLSVNNGGEMELG